MVIVTVVFTKHWCALPGHLFRNENYHIITIVFNFYLHYRYIIVTTVYHIFYVEFTIAMYCGHVI